MLDDEKLTQPLGGVQLLSYSLGELDSDAQKALEARIEADPALKDELAEIREHMRLHQVVRKVAPRRGSFERLRSRMKKEGAFQGAIPGAHAMLRRSFMLAVLVGVIAVVILIAVGSTGGPTTMPDVIGQIVFTNPALRVGERRAEVERDYLKLWKEGDKPYDTGAYDAYIWLPTGVENTYSTIELSSNTVFKFTATRRIELEGGFARRLEVQPGGMGEGPFVVVTPHCTIEIEQGALSVNITRDGVETQVSVGEGNARVYGLDSNRSFPVPAGYCTSVERGKLPNPARPVLKLILDRVVGSNSVIQATLVNDGYVPVKVRRAVDADNMFPDPVYLLHTSHVSEYSPEEGVPENVTLPPWPVTPEPDLAAEHTGDMWLDAGQYYRFTFDISPLLISTPPVEHWLRLEYRGDLYGPPGQARVRIESHNLKLDLRKR
jgi:hypothetical protein